MTQKNIEKNLDSDSNVQLKSGETTSMKLFQSMYNDITGKTESLSQRLTDNHVINYENIEQLNYKISQLYEQYNIIGNSCNITIYHINDSKEVFSSFNRFKVYNKSSPSPTENININYKFLIKLPETDKAQTYELSINLHSRVGYMEKTSSEMSLSLNLIRFLPNFIGSYKIEYVDYTVARTFKHAIDEWYSTIPKHPKNKLLNWVQGYSSHFAWIFRVLISAILVWKFYAVAEEHVLTSSDLKTIFPLAVFGFGTIFIAAQLAYQIGNSLERIIDSFQPISALQINIGDDQSIKKYRSSNFKNMYWLLINGAGSVLLTTISSLIIRYFGLI